MMRVRLSAGCGLLLLAWAAPSRPQAPTAPPVVGEPVIHPAPPASHFKMAPVRVHLLRSADAPAVGTTLTPQDIRRIFGKVDGIWKQAGVSLWVESIIEKKPADLSGHAVHPLIPTEVVPIDALKALRRNGDAGLADGPKEVVPIDAPTLETK